MRTFVLRARAAPTDSQKLLAAIDLYSLPVMVGKVPGHENLGEKSWVLFKR